LKKNKIKDEKIKLFLIPHSLLIFQLFSLFSLFSHFQPHVKLTCMDKFFFLSHPILPIVFIAFPSSCQELSFHIHMRLMHEAYFFIFFYYLLSCNFFLFFLFFSSCSIVHIRKSRVLFFICSQALPFAHKYVYMEK
jgi:hypothetical protein